MSTSEPNVSSASRPPRSAAPDGGLSAQLTRILDGLARLISQHLELARLEFAEEARAVGGGVARVLAFLPLVMVGYVFLCGGLALWIGDWLTPAAGWAIVGSLNLVVGAVGILLAVRALNRRPEMFSATRDELKASAEALRPLSSRVGALPDGR